MSVRVRKLEPEICYIFNGRDFIVNNNLPAAEYRETLSRCLENDGGGGGDEEGLPVPQKKNRRVKKSSLDQI